LALTVLLGSFAQARGQESVAALPRGVAAPDLKLCYVTSFRHTIEAVNLKSGKFVWEAAVDGVPLAVADNCVLVLASNPKKANVGTVNAVDLQLGRQSWRSDPFTLPDWVAVAPAPDRYFGTVARFKDGDLWLKWRALAWKPGAKDPFKTAGGVVRVDLKSHKVELLGADKMPPPALPPGVSKALAKQAARTIETPAGPETVVATVGNLAVALDVEKGSVTLKRWDLKTEKALAPVVLAKGGPFLATPYPSAGAVLLRPVPPAKGLLKATVFQVFSLETGKRLASFRVEATALEAAIRGSQLYYVFLGPYDAGMPNSPQNPLPWVRQLRVLDVQTGQKLWTQALETLPWNPFSSGHCCCNCPP
jgi:hypothetical protein